MTLGGSSRPCPLLALVAFGLFLALGLFFAFGLLFTLGCFSPLAFLALRLLFAFGLLVGLGWLSPSAWVPSRPWSFGLGLLLGLGLLCGLGRLLGRSLRFRLTGGSAWGYRLVFRSWCCSLAGVPGGPLTGG